MGVYLSPRILTCICNFASVVYLVVVTKLTYAANAWWRFATAADRQRVEAVLRRGVRSGLCRSDILTAAELIEDLDDD